MRIRLLVAAVTAAAVGWFAGSAVALDNGVARTPPMGFNDWNAFGCKVSERLIERSAEAMISSGMAAAGYRNVNIDDCRLKHVRDAAGKKFDLVRRRAALLAVPMSRRESRGLISFRAMGSLVAAGVTVAVVAGCGGGGGTKPQRLGLTVVPDRPASTR